ncbi:MAG TPA: hypothetical protein ENJ56_06780 [Anaerolineae bacterium]|nr:hypothetical protein [Anaerolineae bacterium]
MAIRPAALAWDKQDAYPTVMTKKKPNAPTDYRAQRKKEERNLVLLIVFTLIVVGGGITTLIYGPIALIGSLICLIGGSILVVLVWGGFTFLDKFTD